MFAEETLAPAATTDVSEPAAPAVTPAPDEPTGDETPPAVVEPDTKSAEGTGIFRRIPLRVTVDVRGGYDDNVFTETNGHGSGFTETGLELSWQPGDSRTKVDLKAAVAGTYYYDRPGDDFDFSAHLGLKLTHRATPRLSFDATVYLSYQAEPTFAVNAGPTRRSGNYFYSADKFSVTYLWAPRFATSTSYSLGTVQYDSNSIGSFANRVEHTFGEEFRFLWQPTTTLAGEYRFEVINYDNIPRDSATHFVLAGFDHAFSPRLNLTARGGGEFRSYDNGPDRSSPYFESSLTYAVAQRTTASWTNRYSIEEPDLPNVPTRKTFRTGLQLKHGFMQRITVSAAAYYEHDENEEVNELNSFTPAFSEDGFDLAASVRYAITRAFVAEIGYSHTEVFSELDLRGYSRNRFFGGVFFSF